MYIFDKIHSKVDPFWFSFAFHLMGGLVYLLFYFSPLILGQSIAELLIILIFMEFIFVFFSTALEALLENKEYLISEKILVTLLVSGLLLAFAITLSVDLKYRGFIFGAVILIAKHIWKMIARKREALPVSIRQLLLVAGLIFLAQALHQLFPNASFDQLPEHSAGINIPPRRIYLMGALYLLVQAFLDYFIDVRRHNRT